MRRVVVPAVVLAATLLTGCGTVSRLTGPLGQAATAQCRVASSHRIVCEDETTTTPREKVLNVVFQLRNADTGTPVETKSINPGAIPREVSFSGLANGSYEIRHTVQARDCSATFTTYAGLEVF